MRHHHLSTYSSLAFFIIFSLFHFSLSQNQNVLRKGSSLHVGSNAKVLVSPDKSYTCGFHAAEGTNAYYFAIWFTNSKPRTVVWMANRNRPVNGRGSKLSLRSNGVIVLTDVDGTTVWQSNITSSTYATRAVLLNTGNLVLQGLNDTVLWQTFDIPTDTLLPSQQLTKDKRLVSSRNGGHASGFYSLYFDSDNVLKMVFDGPDSSSLYWPSPDLLSNVFQQGRTNINNTRIAVFDDNGRFDSSDSLQFNATNFGLGILRRLTLDYDGNLRLYSLNSATGLWSVSWEAIRRKCDVRGLCGRNAICVYTPEPRCACPPGFEINDPSDWTSGCKPRFKKTCTEHVKFVELPGTDFYGYDLDVLLTPTSFNACRELCLKSCNCLGFSYRLTGEGFCFTKKGLFNGVQIRSFPASIYLKLPVSLQIPDYPKLVFNSSFTCASPEATVLLGTTSMYDITEKKVKWAYLYSFSGAIDGYKELKKATKNFKTELGRGGSGAVYMGVLADERVVAVKRLAEMFQGDEEFLAELSTIGRISHMNLVRMWGFCSEGKHRLLVYEYVSNLSLDTHLFTSNFIGWKESEFEPKIADFGLAKLSKRGAPNSEFSRIRGTKGYMAPEWALNLPITAKVDVYSYGVVILEMIKGIRLSNWVVDNDEVQEVELTKLVRMMKSKILDREVSWLEDTVDQRLEGKFNRNEAEILIKIGLACVEEDRSRRPTMDSVVQTLLRQNED
ncbi:putative receptor protein kinase ZmPK1 [Heracleum sosnowskyi]|uniref:Receptor-like serine/threonine-protein kinase n=1 Tax=Heracleum sosnowskyi TaxID=360622 RepID=A0AAD8N6S0_9APIA|nr:putative receptor protein kinase ZmPK1 [Heracleum sosnowskyi]